MEVNRVNNQNSNVGLYTGVATVAGGGVGALAGWNTKPFLKDDGPSDVFIKNVIPKFGQIISEDNPVYAEAKKLIGQINKVETIDELKASILKPLEENYRSINDVEILKEMLKAASENEELINGGSFATEEINNIKSVDDFIALCKKSLDKTYEGKTINDLRQASEKELQRFMKDTVKMIFGHLWDPETKKFIEIDKEVPLDDNIMDIVSNSRKIMDETANNMKGKAALIYGLSTAAIAGLGTFIGVKLLHKPDVKNIEQDMVDNIQK